MNLADQIAVAGDAMASGIPSTTVAFGPPGNQDATAADAHTLDIFTDIQKAPVADHTETRDNDNEVIVMKRTNKRMRLTFSAKPHGAAKADAQAIAAACPLEKDIVVVTCALDAQIGTSAQAYVESASVRYSPEGDVVIDFVVMKYPKTFVPVS